MNIWRVVYIHIFVSDNLLSSNNCFQSSSSCSNYSSSIISIFFILWISSILSLPLRDLYLQEYSILFHVYRSCFNLPSLSPLSLFFLSLIYLFLKHSICTYECRSFNVYKILSFSFYVFLLLLLLITILTIIIIIIVVLFQSISKKNTTTTAAASTVVMVVVFVPIVTIILLWIV